MGLEVQTPTDVLLVRYSVAFLIKRNSRTDGRSRTDRTLWFYGQDIRGASPPRFLPHRLGRPHNVPEQLMKNWPFRRKINHDYVQVRPPLCVVWTHIFLLEADLQGLLLSRGALLRAKFGEPPGRKGHTCQMRTAWFTVASQQEGSRMKGPISIPSPESSS